MPYVPPHLRGGGKREGEGPPPPPPAPGRGGRNGAGGRSHYEEQFSSFSSCGRKGEDLYSGDGGKRGNSSDLRAEQFSSFGSSHGRREEREERRGGPREHYDYGGSFGGRSKAPGRDDGSYSSFTSRGGERGDRQRGGGGPEAYDGYARSRTNDRRDNFNDRGSNYSASREGRERSDMQRGEEKPEPLPPPKKWSPSARVLALTPEQIAEIRSRLKLTVEVPEGQPDAVAAIETFEDMNLDASIVADIAYHGYERPTPIQCQAIPVALSGRHILGCAETGSGKTASFAIPLIQKVMLRPRGSSRDPCAVVLAPTRELAQQIQAEVTTFSKTARLRSITVVGGTQMGEQRASLRAGVDILVATPGRLIDHLHQENTTLRQCHFLVLDEADRMLDMGFEPQIREILSSMSSVWPQTLLFSATMPPEIEELSSEYLKDPVRVKVGRVTSPAANVAQHLEKVTDATKDESMLAMVLEEFGQAQRDNQPLPLTIIFVAMKNRCDDIVTLLKEEGLIAVALHGGRSQAERESALREFRDGRIPILVATDVASRGLDVSGVSHVINLDLPRSLEEYVHRIGRTGRAGATGRATSFYSERDTFIVTRIRTALAEAASGNVHAFSTTRKKDKELAAAKREEEEGGGGGGGGSGGGGGGAVQVLDHRMRGMLVADAGASSKGNADDAWDD